MKKAFKKLSLVGASVALSLVVVACTDNNEGIDVSSKIEGKDGFSTEYFLVTDNVDNRFVDTKSLATNSNAPYGYILDNDYKLGDVVKVTYKNDDIRQERVLSDKEIKESNVKDFIKASNCGSDELLAEDGTCVNENFYQ